MQNAAHIINTQFIKKCKQIIQKCHVNVLTTVYGNVHLMKYIHLKYENHNNLQPNPYIKGDDPLINQQTSDQNKGTQYFCVSNSCTLMTQRESFRRNIKSRKDATSTVVTVKFH